MQRGCACILLLLLLPLTAWPALPVLQQLVGQQPPHLSCFWATELCSYYLSRQAQLLLHETHWV
jgi:hypothetical protein